MRDNSDIPCYFLTTEIGDKILIPGCMSVVMSSDIDDCICSSVIIYENIINQKKEIMSERIKVNTPGHNYELSSFEGTNPQVIQFIEKVKQVEGDVLKTLNDGTTNEAVLEVLIHRMYYLQDKFPSRENAIVIRNLEESLMWLEKRTSDRQKRGVEGKHLK